MMIYNTVSRPYLPHCKSFPSTKSKYICVLSEETRIYDSISGRGSMTPPQKIYVLRMTLHPVTRHKFLNPGLVGLTLFTDSLRPRIVVPVRVRLNYFLKIDISLQKIISLIRMIQGWIEIDGIKWNVNHTFTYVFVYCTSQRANYAII